MVNPPVSCVCPTFGRVNLLEEALHSFLIQDYKGKKQLIILNDFNQQRLHFKHPEVKIINLPKRVRHLGTKRNMTVDYSDYDFIANWDSDDIYLPHSLSTRVKHMTKDYSKFIYSLVIEGNNAMRFHKALFPGQAIYTRKIFDLVGGYPDINICEDIEFEKSIPEENKEYHDLKNESHYIYKWHTLPKGDNMHFSVIAAKATDDLFLKTSYDFLDQCIKKGTEPVGNIRLEPKWNENYSEITNSFLKTKSNNIFSMYGKEIDYRNGML